MNTINESCHTKTNIVHVVSDIAKSLYYYVQWTGHFVCKKDFYIYRSNFDSFLLLYTVKGNAVLRYKGVQYHIGDNSLMLIDCNHLHEYFPLEDGWNFKYIHFKGNMSREYYEHILSLYNTVVFHASGNIEHYLDELFRLTAKSGAEETCSDYIYRILTKIIYGYRLEKEAGLAPTWLTQAIEYISQNYHEDIKVDDMADMFHFSRCYFSTTFKRHTGFSPHQYITNHRIAEAKWLLFSTTGSIDTIAHKCGFQNTSSFIRTFKKHEKASPMAFRKSNAKKQI